MRKLLLSAFVMSALATVAQAAVVTVSAPLTGIDSYYGIGDIQVPVFNTALGTLTGATFNTSASLSEYVRVVPTSNVPLPSAGTFDTVFTAKVSGLLQFPTYTAPVQNVFTPLVPLYIVYPAPAGTGTVQAQFNNSFSLSSADLPAVEDSPLFIQYDISVNPTNPAPGLRFPDDASFSVIVTGFVNVAYTYTPSSTPVPEPASLSILGFGLAAVGAYRHRLGQPRY